MHRTDVGCCQICGNLILRSQSTGHLQERMNECKREKERMVWFGLVSWHINQCSLFNVKSCLYIYIKYLIWFDCILWPINLCRLFNVKSCLYIYILNIWFGLIAYYGLSTFVGYLMSNPVYTYILNIWFGLIVYYGLSTFVRLFNVKSCLYIYIKYIICKHILLITFLNEIEIFLHTVK